MSKFGYYLLRAVTWIIQLFPLRANYILSDFFYLLAYHIIRYRRNVVAENLKNSFPEKSRKQRTKIAKKFYAHFCDQFIETLYFDRIPADEIKKRVVFKNLDLIDKYLKLNRQVIKVLGHYNNWEWQTSWSLHSDQQFLVVYKKLRDKNFDLFYYNLRKRFGCIPIEKTDVVRTLIKNHNENSPSFSGYLIDQTPKKHEIQYWTNFLNQDTPVVVGTEKIAKKLDAVVVFSHMKKIKRGYYEVVYELLFEHAKNTDTFEITEKVNRTLEKEIIEEPAYWLWSHKRWKHRREVG